MSSLGEVEEFASDEFRSLVAELQQLTIVIEHLAGVGQGAEPPYAAFKKAMGLGAYPNAYIKVGGLGRSVPDRPCLALRSCSTRRRRW